MKKKWFYNELNGKETHAFEIPEGKGWKLGRLPYYLWNEERRNSYREKRKNIVYTDEYREKQSLRTKKYQKDRVAYTNGEKNIWLRIGQDIPEGFYKGWFVDNPIKYWSNAKKLETIESMSDLFNGECISCLKQLMGVQP